VPLTTGHLEVILVGGVAQLAESGRYMRIWDVDPHLLCRQHLIGEHYELHCCWNTITRGRKAWSHHPETKRWVGKLKALFHRHTALAKEMRFRGFSHKSDLDKELAVGRADQTVFLQVPAEQIEILRARSTNRKRCTCAERFQKLGI
jgi:hypothetical protein